MHRDHKLGLALGVLVVGFAAALCFPKQTDVDQRLLQLDNSAELDADIAQLPVRAYTNADPSPPADPSPTPPQTAPDPAVTVPGGDATTELLAGPPAPIAAEPRPATATPAMAADQEAAAGVAAQIPFDVVEDHPASAPDGQHYTVQPGDTLSSLAAEFLGNHGRYVELFEANREVLATPDDLRPGMVLHIPAAVTDGDDRLVLPDPAAASGRLDPGAPENPPAAGSDAAGDQRPQAGERPRLFRPAGAAPFLKAQPISRESAAPLPTMDASSNRRDGDEVSSDSREARTYQVRRGDTLEGIAVKAYGDARAVRDLLNANQNVVRDPRRLRPGTTLTLPDRE